MTIFNMGNAAGAEQLGFRRNYFDWEYSILSFSFIVLFAMMVLNFLRINQHKQQVKDLVNEKMN